MKRSNSTRGHMQITYLTSRVRRPLGKLRQAMITALQRNSQYGHQTPLERAFPRWAYSDGPALTDEIIEGPWTYHVLQMANRHFEPEHLAYHRTQYGEDHRIKYIAYFLDLRGLRTLELGPFEGHHSVLLEKMGVRENIAIEARTENIRKCIRIKEKYGLTNTTFIQQNLEDLYNGKEQPRYSGKFDLVICLGVLYHLPDPAKALEWCRTQSDILFLGTHYVEKEDLWRYAGKYYEEEAFQYRGEVYRVKRCIEGGRADPISGMSPTSLWVYEDDLLRMLRDCGYSSISVLGKDLQNGFPHITILAHSCSEASCRSNG
jgi:2-polyprenyl-3-methyl-5-hydroxy-6-metoxy-1,4-benzoquinol methylase